MFSKQTDLGFWFGFVFLEVRITCHFCSIWPEKIHLRSGLIWIPNSIHEPLTSLGIFRNYPTEILKKKKPQNQPNKKNLLLLYKLWKCYLYTFYILRTIISYNGTEVWVLDVQKHLFPLQTACCLCESKS